MVFIKQMKKLLEIIFFVILLSSSSVAKDFYIVCDGKVQTTTTMHNSVDNLFEEWKITLENKKIKFIELINTGNWNYRSVYFPGEFNILNNVINIEVYNAKADRGYTIKKYIHSISLNSGRFSWSQFLDSSSSSWVFQGQGRCQGYKEILNQINN